jgi:hypothetical protein
VYIQQKVAVAHYTFTPHGTTCVGLEYFDQRNRLHFVQPYIARNYLRFYEHEEQEARFAVLPVYRPRRHSEGSHPNFFIGPNDLIVMVPLAPRKRVGSAPQSHRFADYPVARLRLRMTTMNTAPPVPSKSTVPFPMILSEMAHARLKPLPMPLPPTASVDSYESCLPIRTPSQPQSPLKSPETPFPVSLPLTPDYDGLDSLTASPTSPSVDVGVSQRPESDPSTYSQRSAAISRPRSPVPGPRENTTLKQKVGAIWNKLTMGCCGSNQ